MIELSDAAKKQIDNYFQGQDPVPIRIFLNTGGWAGPSLAMALDEPKDTDDIYNVKGIEFVVDKEFMERARKIEIDFNGMGFTLDSGIDLGQGGNCGGCSGGSCG